MTWQPWTPGGDNDERWERAEEADDRATRRREAEDRARLMDVSEPPVPKCATCGDYGFIPDPAQWVPPVTIIGRTLPCPACKAVTP